MVALGIGVAMAIAIGWMARSVGLDRDRAFYPTVMIVIAALYSLFAVMGGSTQALLTDAAVGALFLAAALYGFRTSLWIVAAALVAHGILDLFHGAVVANPGVPAWWPEFCSGYDVAAGAYLAWLLKSGRVRATS